MQTTTPESQDYRRSQQPAARLPRRSSPETLLLPFALKAREAGLQAGRFPFLALSCQQQPLEMRRSAALEAETSKRNNNNKQMKKITITR
jgi:hypothetical protein